MKRLYYKERLYYNPEHQRPRRLVVTWTEEVAPGGKPLSAYALGRAVFYKINELRRAEREPGEDIRRIADFKFEEETP